MRKEELVIKLQNAERFIADRLAQNAALKQAYREQDSRIEALRTILRGLMSRNLFKRLWAARKRVR